MSILSELQRRNVLRVAAGYVAVSWLIVQVMDTLSDAFALTGEHIRVAVIVLAICFIPVLIISWVFELTPEGFKRDADVERDTPAAQKSKKRLDRIAIRVLCQPPRWGRPHVLGNLFCPGSACRFCALCLRGSSEPELAIGQLHRVKLVGTSVATRTGVPRIPGRSTATRG